MSLILKPSSARVAAAELPDKPHPTIIISNLFFFSLAKFVKFLTVLSQPPSTSPAGNFGLIKLFILLIKS